MLIKKINILKLHWELQRLMDVTQGLTVIKDGTAFILRVTSIFDRDHS
jgi:hypothetical protein